MRKSGENTRGEMADTGADCDHGGGHRGVKPGSIVGRGNSGRRASRSFD